MKGIINFNIVKEIIFEKAWINFLLIGTLFMSFKNFFSTIMIQNGIEIKDTLLILGIIYLSSGIINLYKKKVTKNTLKNYSLLVILFMGLSICFEQYFVLFISISILIISLLSSSLMVQSYSFFNELSIKKKTKIEKVIISSLFISMIASPLIMSFLGYIGDKNHLYYYFAGLTMMAYVYLNTKSGIYTEEKNVIKTDSIFKKHRANKVHLICSLSFVVNMIRNVFVFFYIPLSILTITKNLGMEGKSLAIIGLVASIGSLVAFASRMDNKKNNPEKTMFLYAFLCILIFLIMSLLLHRYLDTQPIFISIIGIILIIFLEISSKLWSIGFFGTLNKQSKNKIENEKNLKTFNIYFMIGISFGFFITYICYGYLNIHIIMSCLSLIGIFYTLLLYFYFKKQKYI